MRSLFDRLSGAQITAISIALIAAFVPGSLLAVSAFTNVAIQDPLTGKRASVDNSGRLIMAPTDPFQYYKDAPNYQVDVQFTVDTSHAIYSVPSNYYFVLTAVTGSLTPPANGTAAGFYLIGSYRGGITGIFTAVTTFAPISYNFGSGIALNSGETISVDARGAGNTGLYLHGYLVPYSAFSALALPSSMTYVNSATNTEPQTRGSPPRFK